MMCRHCQETTVSRPRGLCWSCYYREGVRDLYPSTSKYGRRGPGNSYSKPLPAAGPTDAMPGSPEKILILMQRAQARQELWHPDDATLAGPVGERELAQVG